MALLRNKKKGRATKKSSALQNLCTSDMNTFWCDFTKKLFITFFGILLVYIIIFFGTLIQNNMERFSYIKYENQQQRTVRLQAVGSVIAQPDTATISMGVISEATDVQVAQAENTQKMNQLIARLRALGIASEDIQVKEYTVYPRYDYIEDQGRVFLGYTVNQEVYIKIRDVSKADKVVVLAGEIGITKVSDLQFLLQDTDVYIAQAREEAVEKIMEKANTLSQLLGVDFVNIIHYNEYEDHVSPRSTGVYYETEAYGVGGRTEKPDIQAGSKDIRIRVEMVVEIN
ncbi:MAG: hypothetical protein CL685_00430 [Candidatus Magasanikbacteria bacterium]|nr:hypothetical protein [Candidatus Magasanikbacteria bacterium]|tara:strand:- start:610 stop:1467 length:858 start_codon:yes stop_codon:yes gene_type:complete